jgi:hypothetical protein
MRKPNDLTKFCKNENEIIAFGEKIKSKIQLKIKNINSKNVPQLKIVQDFN